MSDQHQLPSGGTVAHTDSVQSLPANPYSISTVENMRLSEMEGIHTRLGRICAAKREDRFLDRLRKSIEWDRCFGALAALFFGAALGGAIALVPLLGLESVSGERAISDRELVEYVVVVAICAAFGCFALIARMAIRSEREDSVLAIYADLGDIVGRYEQPRESRTSA